MRNDYLFDGDDLREYLQGRVSSVLDAIANLTPEKIDGFPADEWAA